MRRRCNQLLNQSERGSILALVMVTLSVLSLLGLAVATVSFANVNLTNVDRDYQSSYYIAEAGANQTYAEINTIVASAYEIASSVGEFYHILNDEIAVLDGRSLSNFSSYFKEMPLADIEIQELTDSNPRQYQIVSKGKIGNRTRTVTKAFRINWQSKHGVSFPNNAAAVVKNRITLTEGASIRGDIHVDSTDQGIISMDGGTSISGGVAYVPMEAVHNAVSTSANFGGTPPEVRESTDAIPWSSYDQIIASFPTFPGYAFPEDETIGGPYNRFDVIKNGDLNINSWQANGYTLDLSRSMSLGNISITNDNTLNIDTHDQDQDIVVDNLLVSQGHIKLIGSGTVNIYVKNEFSLGGGTTFNQNGSVSQLNIYLAGKNKSLELDDNQQINGSMFAEDTSVTLTGGGGFKGYIVTGADQVIFDGGSFSNLLLLAPNAEAKVLSGANISGTMITKQLIGTGGANVTFDELNEFEFPFGNVGSSGEIITEEPTVELE